MNFSENKSFCALPWCNLSTHTDGNIRLCCVSDNFILKPDGSNYNLGKDNIQDIINSSHYQSIRTKMLKGELNEGCTKCYEIEDHGGKSYRNYYNEFWLSDTNVEFKINQSIANNSIESTVQYLDIRFGNTCNLACRSCYPGASSQFNREVKEIKNKNILKYHHVIEDNMDWYRTDTFNQNVANQIKNIKSYYINGGEPTIVEENLNILKYMIETGFSKEITLQFNSNMTNTRKDFYDLLPHFKKISFWASIDGYGPMQEYLRYPSKWSQIESNLYKLLNFDINLELRITPVISKYNLGTITTLFDYIENINKIHNKKLIQIFPIILYDPDYLDFSYLPVDYKLNCLDRIKKWASESSIFQDSMLFSKIKIIESKCNEVLDYTENLNKFREFNNIFDTHRNQRLGDVNPELDSIVYK